MGCSPVTSVQFIILGLLCDRIIYGKFFHIVLSAKPDIISSVKEYMMDILYTYGTLDMKTYHTIISVCEFSFHLQPQG